MAPKWLKEAKRRLSKEIPAEQSLSTSEEPTKASSREQVEADPSPKDPASSSEQLSKKPTGRPAPGLSSFRRSRKQDVADESKLLSEAVEKSSLSSLHSTSRQDLDEVRTRHHTLTPPNAYGGRHRDSNSSLRSTHRRGPIKGTGSDRLQQQAEVHKYGDGSKLT